MTDFPPVTTPDTADSPALRSVFRGGLTFAFFNATNWMISLGTPMVLLAETLGASTFQVGLAYSFVYLLLPIQVLSTAALPRHGYRAQMVFAWSSRNVFLLIPFALAALAPAHPQPWMAHLLVFSVFGFCLCRSLGSSAWLPWIYELIPESRRGRFFASDQFVSGIASVGTLLVCAAAFRWLDGYLSFAAVYLLAIIGALFAVSALRRLPDVDRPPSADLLGILRASPRLIFGPGLFRSYLAVNLAYSAVTNAFTPFVAYYFAVEAGFPRETVMIYAAAQYLGSITGGLWTRTRIDGHDPRTWFAAHLVVMAGVGLVWSLHLLGVPGLLPLLPATCFGAGLAASLWTAGHLKYLAFVCPGPERHVTLSLHTAVVGLIAGLSPTLWGFFLREPDVSGTPGMNLGAFATYFVIGLVIQAGLWIAVHRLPPVDPATPSLTGTGALFRPFRMIAGLVQARRPERPPNAP